MRGEIIGTYLSRWKGNAVVFYKRRVICCSPLLFDKKASPGPPERQLNIWWCDWWRKGTLKKAHTSLHMSLSQMPFLLQDKLFMSHLAKGINNYMQNRFKIGLLWGALHLRHKYKQNLLCWEYNWQPLWQDRPQVRPPLCSASAYINLRKAQAVVNILFKAIRLGTRQDEHIPGSGADKALPLCVDYGILEVSEQEAVLDNTAVI